MFLSPEEQRALWRRADRGRGRGRGMNLSVEQAGAPRPAGRGGAPPPGPPLGPGDGAEARGPRELNTSLHGTFLKILPDRLNVQYIGKGAHAHDVGAVQADAPVPLLARAYYFEMTVKESGDRGCIAIGYTHGDFKLSRQPGWEPDSYGYHGDDGKKYHNSGRGEEYGPQYETGDTVGAGYHLEAQEIFFTKNGKDLGLAFKGVRGSLFPTVGLHSTNEHVELNFGQKPFKFDIEALLAEEKGREEEEIMRAAASADDVTAVVRKYLLHYGYADTLRAFDAATGHPPQPVYEKFQELALRKRLRELILAGDIDGAVAELRRGRFGFIMEVWTDQPGAAAAPEGGAGPGGAAPTALRFSSAYFHLKLQKYIELVREQKIAEAIEFAREELAVLQHGRQKFDALLQDALALLAFKDPGASKLAYLMAPAHREAVADVVNSEILDLAWQEQGEPAEGRPAEEGAAFDLLRKAASGGPDALRDVPEEDRPEGFEDAAHSSPSQSLLSKLLSQLTRVKAEIHAAHGGQGELFRLEDHLLLRKQPPSAEEWNNTE